MANETSIQPSQQLYSATISKPVIRQSESSGSVSQVNALGIPTAVVQRQEVSALGKELPQRQTQAKDSHGEPDEESLQQAVNQINDLVQQLHRNLQFTVDKDTGRTIVRVIDAETDEVVRQIPSEELLAIARHIKESMEGDEMKGAFISDTA